MSDADQFYKEPTPQELRRQVTELLLTVQSLSIENGQVKKESDHLQKCLNIATDKLAEARAALQASEKKCLHYLRTDYERKLELREEVIAEVREEMRKLIV